MASSGRSNMQQYAEQEKTIRNAEDCTDDASSSQQSKLPAPLARIRTRRYMLGAALLIAVVGFAITMHDPKILSMSLIALYVLYTGLHLERQYAMGTIKELVLICTSVRQKNARDSISIDFISADEEDPVHYRFNYPGRSSAEDFIPNAVYVVYVSVDKPDALLTYLQVS